MFVGELLNKAKFIRDHFKEPTDKQVQKAWTKIQAISGYQKILEKMPKTTTRDLIVFDKLFQTWAKMTGAFIPEVTSNTTNNVIFISRAENKAAWELQAKLQQQALRDKTKVASDTIINARNSS